MKITTLEEAFNIVQRSKDTLHAVPIKLKTPKLCKAAVENDGCSLRYVPEALKTPELCNLAIKQDIKALMFIPDALRTPELCKIVVEQNGDFLKYVPNQKSFLKTYPEFLPLYFKKTDKLDQDPELISLLILTANKKDIEDIWYTINRTMIKKTDIPFLIGCQKKTITDFLNKKFKTKGT